MKTTRNTPTAFRFDPAVKDALSVIAERDGRSMANMLEWLIKQHCEREGLGWPLEGSKSSAAAQSKSATPAKAAAKASKAKKK